MDRSPTEPRKAGSESPCEGQGGQSAQLGAFGAERGRRTSHVVLGIESPEEREIQGREPVGCAGERRPQ